MGKVQEPEHENRPAPAIEPDEEAVNDGSE